MIMLTLVAVLALGAASEPAADSVTFRDGKTLLGQWVEPAPRGKPMMIVRRAWAEKHLPDRFKTWKAAEAATSRRARTDRITRLEAWKRDLGLDPTKNDAISGWIESEIVRLKAPGDLPLLLVTLNRGDIVKLARRSPDAARKLRQAWKAGFDDAETRPLDELSRALEGRGFAVSDVDPAPIDDLLPLSIETENHWLARRAATEVLQGQDGRFIRYAGLVLPEGTPGAINPLEASGAINGLVKELLGEAPAEDPLAAKGRELASRGRVGMLVTRLDMGDDLASSKIDVTLFVRTGQDRWEPAVTRAVSVRNDASAPGAEGAIASDPQVKSIFDSAKGLGFEIPEDLRRKALSAGAATQKALGLARTAIQPDLDRLALPVGKP